MELLKALKLIGSCLVLLFPCKYPVAQEGGFAWRAGDHHIHSRYSVSWDRDSDPPTPIIGGDAIYPIHMNALMAKYHGLDWVVSTDHGGPNHSKLNIESAYPELIESRLVVPEVIQFYGMEFDTPGADHSSLIIPFTENEAQQLFELESRFSRREPWPSNSEWNSELRMLAALRAMRNQNPQPLLIANHPSRSLRIEGEYRMDDPGELRSWNNTAPNVAVGMAGAPGHQAATLNADGSIDFNAARGGYSGVSTLGGFDQFTAKLGGFWDSMIGEGRNWWITANSDSHVHYSEGGSDFWPGEYSKTYVWSEKNHESIMDGIRNGRMFVTTGDLIDQLYLTVRTDNGSSASIGGRLMLNKEQAVTVTIRFREPKRTNANGDRPTVSRLDLILGEIIGPLQDDSIDFHASARVLERFKADAWEIISDYKQLSFELPALTVNSYLRVRGTNTNELEPQIDPRGENPWSDLWFYSNPVRLTISQ